MLSFIKAVVPIVLLLSLLAACTTGTSGIKRERDEALAALEVAEAEAATANTALAAAEAEAATANTALAAAEAEAATAKSALAAAEAEAAVVEADLDKAEQEAADAKAELAAIPQPPHVLTVPEHMHVGVVLSSAVTRNFAENSVSRGGLQATRLTSDGAGGYHLTYTDAAGQENTFHFLAEHSVSYGFRSGSGPGGHRLYAARDAGWYDYTSIMGFGINIGEGEETTSGNDTNFIIGDRTPISGIPTQGTATYMGRFRAYAWPVNDPARAANIDYRSSRVSLTADLDVGRMTGRISDVYAQDDNDVQTTLTGHIDIASSWIVDGQFTSTLTGLDPDNPNAPVDSSVRGLTGDLFGQFYGPNADEVGGVVNASHGNMVMSGTIIAAQGRRTGAQ